MRRRIVTTSLVAFITLSLAVHIFAANVWRSATEKELSTWVPAKALVVKERIETEFRTASGIVDSEGRYVAGVVLITAGYSANGKYSNFLVTQVPLKIGTAFLQPGEYVFGWHRVNDSLQVLFYEAASGRYLGEVLANRDDTHRRIESFQILPPSEHSLMLIGRFAFHYQFAR
ncbi:MAG: hypothetical protein WA708_19000 [Acidobacteriaceae bacterium]